MNSELNCPPLHVLQIYKQKLTNDPLTHTTPTHTNVQTLLEGNKWETKELEALEANFKNMKHDASQHYN